MNKTKIEVVEELRKIEDRLIDLIPEEEVDTQRAKVLDSIEEISGKTSKEIEGLKMIDLQNLLTEGKQCLAIETEVKKKSKMLKKKDTAPKADKSAKEPKKNTAVVPKEETKPVAKKVEPKLFPEEMETSLGVFKEKKIKSLKDIKEADLIVCSWTAQDLEDFEYDNTGILSQPTKFDQDIDVCTVIDEDPEGKIIYALSVSTRKMYHFLKEDIKGMISDGMPWRVYTNQE